MQEKQSASLMTMDQAASSLNISKNQLRRMIEDKILAPVVKDGEALIPLEFIQSGRPLPSLRGTLILLGDIGFSDAESIKWLFTYNEDLEDYPIDSLIKGHKAPVRRVAQMAAELL